MIPKVEKEKTLKDIRKSLSDLDTERFRKRSTYEDVAILENAICQLRDAERALIEDKENELIARLKDAAQTLSIHSKNVRANVAKMNRTAKVMDDIEGIVKRVAEVIREFNRWN